MIQVSAESLVYDSDQKMKQIYFSNISSSPILFKVKTNNIEAIDARPNQGRVQPSDKIKLIIRKNKSIFKSNVKIQITCTQCNQELTKQNFKQLWAQYGKKAEHTTISLCEKYEVENQKPKSEEMAFKSMKNETENLQSFIKEQSAISELKEEQRAPEPKVEDLSKPIQQNKPQVVVEAKPQKINSHSNTQQSPIPTKEATFMNPLVIIAIIISFMAGYFVGSFGASSQAASL